MTSVEITEQIDNLRGADALGATLRTLICDDAIPYNSLEVRDLPHIVLSIDEGCGMTTIGKLIADVVFASNILPVYSTSYYLELQYPRYGTPDDYARFFESSRVAADLGNDFGGVFLVDISGWEDALESRDFENLMRFAARSENSARFVFATQAKDERTVCRILSVVRRTLYARAYQVDKPDTEVFVNYAMMLLRRDGVVENDDIRYELENAVKRISFSADFHGFRSVNQCVRDICFERQTQIHETRQFASISACSDFLCGF